VGVLRPDRHTGACGLLGVRRVQFVLCLHRVGGCFFASKADEHNASPATCGKDWAWTRIRLVSLFVFCGLGDIHTCESIIRPLF
jgi:hypothetical protein